MLRNNKTKKAALAGTIIALGILTNIAPVISQHSDKVTFICANIQDQASGEKIPATLVWIPETQQHRRLIGWKSKYFDKFMSNQKRCETVTEKFQTFYDKGTLNYITFGENNGLPILCAVNNIGDICTGESQLFTLKSHSDPKELQAILTDILTGKSSDMLMQSSGEQAYIPFAELLNNSPTVTP